MNATTINGVGCETGPAATYMAYGSEVFFHRALHSLRGYGALCVVGEGFFEGHALDGPEQFHELCNEVGGRIRRL